jgi:hypothetical protein
LDSKQIPIRKRDKFILHFQITSICNRYAIYVPFLKALEAGYGRESRGLQLA